MTAVWAVCGFFTVCWSAVLFVVWRVLRRKPAEDVNTTLEQHWASTVRDPNRRLQGSCGMCGGRFTYRHPSQIGTARAYHYEFECTEVRRAA